MSLNKNYFKGFSLIFFLSIISSNQVFAQEQDSIWTETLENVVITGQLNPQAVDKSVFEVKVITQKEIERRAATNLADLLSQSLHITIQPNPSTGKSSLSLFGLDGQYFKILIDGIPMINEEGVGNNIDLSLINIDNVKRVEFVEGAMGVQYGANALSGILNIITKNPSTDITKISVYAQEESVGSEYEWFKQGKHIQSVQVDHGFSDKFSTSLSYNRNDFGGYWNDREGEVYDKNDNKRGHEWLPKINHNLRLALNYKPLENLNLDYRFDYLTEDIFKYNKTVSLNENPATQTQQPTALDEVYTNLRMMHNLNASGEIFGEKPFSFSASYQKQTKDLERYTYVIRQDQKTNVKKSQYLEREVFFSRGFISKILNTKSTSLQLGYEVNLEKGQGSPFSMSVASSDEESSQELNHYDFFASLEHQFSKRFYVRPGARISTSNLFDEQFMLSLSSRYKFDNNYQLRAVVGSSNRTPTYKELYTYFVDVNHDVQGNPDLNPEKGYSVFVHLKKNFQLSDEINLKSKISASYIDIQDRIELSIASESPLTYKFTNIDAFKTHGIYTENSVFYKNIQLNLGLSLQGVSKTLDSSENVKDDYLYHFQMNANLNYELPKIDAAFTLYFKHIGQQYQFVQKENDLGDLVFDKGKTEAYGWLDASFKKSFFNNQWVATLGIRNLLDVNSINTTAFSGGAHSDAPSAQSIAYGRSYFLRLQYNLNL
ncbi:TonB-dependent receptor plug domain-containing protein [Psychroflexus halocasei]|uniref:Outer membrane receptor for ferrienterochelin and colicins n=1 Tax=Psychroflexus halocasei TaxID=908615 RepID=A0A1H4BSH1_9FLAO|nr:TonB-dependent receptor plug domain-containing protein [Psychroflexus halocasei]SEA51116.1 outer membrane receptor for ferrienterochelin and colicins [Psychroflexus halocasei]